MVIVEFATPELHAIKELVVRSHKHDAYILCNCGWRSSSYEYAPPAIDMSQEARINHRQHQSQQTGFMMTYPGAVEPDCWREISACRYILSTYVGVNTWNGAPFRTVVDPLVAWGWALAAGLEGEHWDDIPEILMPDGV